MLYWPQCVVNVFVVNYAELVLYWTLFSSAYTEPFPMNSISALLSTDEDHGRTSEEEEGAGETSCDRQVSYGTQMQMEAGKWLLESLAVHAPLQIN